MAAFLYSLLSNFYPILPNRRTILIIIKLITQSVSELYKP